MAPKRKTVTSAKQSGNVPSRRKRQPPVKQMVAQSETQKVLMEQQK